MNRLKVLRESKGLTQSELTKKFNINQGNYSRYESGTLIPTTDTLIQLSEFYNVSIDYILGLDKSSKDVKIQLDLISEYINNLKENL